MEWYICLFAIVGVILFVYSFAQYCKMHDKIENLSRHANETPTDRLAEIEREVTRLYETDSDKNNLG